MERVQVAILTCFTAVAILPDRCLRSTSRHILLTPAHCRPKLSATFALGEASHFAPLLFANLPMSHLGQSATLGIGYRRNPADAAARGCFHVRLAERAFRTEELGALNAVSSSLPLRFWCSDLSSRAPRLRLG